MNTVHARINWLVGGCGYVRRNCGNAATGGHAARARGDAGQAETDE